MAYESKPRLEPNLDPEMVNRIIREKHTNPLREKIFGPQAKSPDTVGTAPTPVISQGNDGSTKGSNPLNSFSLLGLGELFEGKAVSTRPLLADVCMAGQSTIIYAQPNTGKTLITLFLIQEAVQARRIAAENVFYVNADDSSSGLAHKMRLMDDIGVHTLAPGFKNFNAAVFLETLRRAAESDTARDTLVVIDTMKKFTNLMDKKLSSDAANICRQYAMRGGSIVALAHTTKSPNVDGSLRYAGTTDFLEDFDAAYIVSLVKATGQSGEHIASFKNIKRRGDNPEAAAFAYTSELGISYDQRLASVRSVDPTQLEQFKVIERRVADDVVVEAIRDSVRAGDGEGKMKLATAAAERCGASRRGVITVIERYEGDAAGRLWTFKTGDRGVRSYVLIDG